MSASLEAASGVQWRLFLRALAEEVDSLAGPEERDDLLRGVGHRMSRMAPLPEVETLEALEIEMNDALAALGWGEVRLVVDEASPALRVVHTGLPRIGTVGTPPGQWLGALLLGLYDGWFQQQPGAQPTLHTHREPGLGGATVIMRYARA